MTRPRQWIAMAAVLCGCGGEPADSMSLVVADPRLTLANCLDPAGSGLEGEEGPYTLVDAMDAVRATDPNLADRWVRELRDADSLYGSRRLAARKRLALRIRAEVAASAQPQPQ